MNCNTTHYRANSSSVPGDPTSKGFIYGGGLGFAAGSFVALWIVSLLWRVLDTGHGPSAVAFAVAAAVLPLFHPLAVMVALPGCVIALAVRFRGVTFRVALMMLATAALGLALNWHWIAPHLVFRDLLGYADVLLAPAPWRRFLYSRVARVASLAVGAAFAWSLVGLFREKSSAQAGLLAGSLAAFLALAFFGDRLGVNQYQPARALIPAWFVLFIGIGLMPRRSALRWPEIAAVTAAMALASAYGVLTAWGRFETRLRPGDATFLAYAQTRLSDEARWLIATKDFKSSQVPGYLPHAARRPTVGGQCSTDFLKTRFSNLNDDVWEGWDFVRRRPVAFGRPLRTWEEKEFGRYLELYNVKTIAANTPTMREIFDGYAGLLSPGPEIGSYRLYEVRRPSNWFLTGSGRLTGIDYDRLSIRGASRGVLILKFHWLATLAATAPVRLQPVYLGGDPVPFIFIDNRAGVADFDIVNAGLPES